MLLRDLDYELPSELIAQRPLDRRDDSRLLVFERASGEVRQRRFSDLPEELDSELVRALRVRLGRGAARGPSKPS